jgi:FkbH-like protein
MRILKLVIWDLDHTILIGILQEGDEEVNPSAKKVMTQLRARGVLQTLATQNQPEVFRAAKHKFDWSDFFIHVEVDLGPKVNKVRSILDRLDVNPLDSAFVDEDPFERDSIAVQVPGISAWSVAELQDYLEKKPTTVTEEGRRRPEMYLAQQVRSQDEERTDNYLEFVRSCEINITVHPYAPEDALRAEELLIRTHQMNLGVLPVEEAIVRLNRKGEHDVFVAEMKDIYGEMGRCGIIHLTPHENDEALIESLAISCRTRARGLSLAMLVGLLRHPRVGFQRFRCRYIYNGLNRPLRMLLMAAGFKFQRGTDGLILSAERLAKVQVPEWVQLNYATLSTNAG